ncbi:MAG: SMC-Scp complex subunit ScpB [Clostridia bacterium]|nr:SMC-Scp complex subunit ScpB [Clostridia bacterium]
MEDNKTIKSILESMMFVWGEPLDYKMAAEILEMDKKLVYDCFLELKHEYGTQNRGVLIQETNKKFQFCTNIENYSYLEKLCTPVKERKLSQAALEVLAIIAYKQPITKAEIDVIRGVKSVRALEGLILRGFIEEKGRDDKIGKPILYGTTDFFLNKFGFKNLNDLPIIDEIEDVIMKEEEAQQMMLQLEEA